MIGIETWIFWVLFYVIFNILRKTFWHKLGIELDYWFFLMLPARKEGRPCLPGDGRIPGSSLSFPDLGRAFYLFWLWVRVLILKMPPWHECVECLISASDVVSVNTRLWGRLFDYRWAVVNVYR